jgi:aspartate aminotransferase
MSAPCVAGVISEQLTRASWIRRMFEEGARLKAEKGSENVFDFTLGNPDLEPPAALIEALRAVVAENRSSSHAYMPNAGYPEVRAEIARRLQAATGLPYTVDHVIMTVGAAGALNVILKAILDPGDEVLLLAPFFAEYEFYVANHGGRMVVVETDKDAQPVVERIAAALTPRTKALILNSPNNPTGVVYEERFFRDLETMLDERGHPLLVLSDEPYRMLAFEGVSVPQVPPLVRRTVLCDSYSKVLAIPGERIGYLAISPAIAEARELFNAAVFALRVLGFVNAPAVWQWTVARARDVRVDPRSYQERCERMYEALTGMGYRAIRPRGAFYVFAETPLQDDVRFVNLLKEEAVLVVPGTGFGRPGHMRLSVTVAREAIERALPGFARARARAGGASGDAR